MAFRFNNLLEANVWTKPAPFAVNASHRFFLRARTASGKPVVKGDLIGLRGRNREAGQDASWGAASGWEMDTSSGATAADGQIVNAWQPGRIAGEGPNLGSDRGQAPTGLEPLARGTNNTAEQGNHAADITSYRHDGGGLVFSAGSVTFGGSLVEDTILQTLILNAVDDAMGSFDPTCALYTAIWIGNDGRGWQARHGQTGEQYQQTFDDVVAQGWRLTDVSGFVR